MKYRILRKSSTPFDKVHEECGVFGIAAPEGKEISAAHDAYTALFALQHRGQEAAGIAVNKNGVIHCHKDVGLVSAVFNQEILDNMPGSMAIGHVRYSTSGGSELENVQPIVARSKIGCIAVAHNGQIVNADELRESLEEQGSIFHGSSDSEIILHLIQRAKGSLLEKIKSACCQLDGAFSVLILTEKSLYAIRDRNGLRPLSLARLGEGFCVSSETCAFDGVGASFLRDIAPGEITFYRLQCDSEGELRAYVAEGEVLPVATRSFGGIGIFAIPEMGRFYRHVLIQKRYPHHGAVAFAHCGKALFEVLKYFGISDIAYNQPKSLPYATENPWG